MSVPHSLLKPDRTLTPSSQGQLPQPRERPRDPARGVTEPTLEPAQPLVHRLVRRAHPADALALDALRGGRDGGEGTCFPSFTREYVSE